MPIARLLAVVGLLSLAVAAHADSGTDWPQWRGPHRDGAAPSSPALIASLPEDGLKPVWQTEQLPAGGWGSPIVADGKAYLFIHFRNPKTPEALPKKKYPYLAEGKRGGMSAAEYVEYEKNRRAEEIEFAKLYEFKEFVFCFDAASGKTLWKNEKLSVYSQFVQSGTLTLADGKLYILGAGRHARCLDAATGQDVWDVLVPGVHVDEFYASSFAVIDGAAIAFAGTLFGLDARTGALLWQGDAKRRGEHSSAVAWRADGRELAIANVASGETICFEPKSGKELWRVRSEANNSTPVIVGDLLITYGSSRRSGLRAYRITPSEAKEAWTYQRLSDKGSSPVVVGNHLYAQGEKRIACLDLATGEESWSTTLDLASPQYTSLVAADGKLFYAFDGLLCFAADAKEFRTLFETKFDKQGLMATDATLRKRLKLDEVEKKPNGLEESTRIYKREVGDQGPVACTSPAIVDGRLILRLRNSLACYDLRAGKAVESSTAAAAAQR
ncbi:MAG: PQQ-like beta-propeller repeat protein [Planctomycetia bacterium]|nr:PQQ-like beta-propeller repeat protein [Planctomycetia bacterium]